MDEFAVRPGESQLPETAASGGEISVKALGEDTQGTFAGLGMPTASVSGPSLHLDRSTNEWFYELEGAHEFPMGDRRYRVSTGGSILGPHLLPHSGLNLSNSRAKMLAIPQPANSRSSR